MRIYDIEFDIDSFLDEMEEKQRARRQRQQQIHRSADAGASVSDGPWTATPTNRRRPPASVAAESPVETLADEQRQRIDRLVRPQRYTPKCRCDGMLRALPVLPT